MKKIILVFMALLLIGCTTVTPQQVNNPTPPPVTTKTYSVGDTIEFDGLRITVNSYRTSKGDQFFKPKNAYYFIIDATLENISKEAKSVSTMLQMKLYDKESYSQDLTIILDAKGSLDGEIAPGRKVRGEVGFDAKASDVYEFVFSGVFTKGQAIWKIPVK